MVTPPVFDGFELVADRLGSKFGKHSPGGLSDEYLRHPATGDRLHVSIRGALFVSEVCDDWTDGFG